MKIAKSLPFLLSALVSTTAFAASDNFNRTTLGSNWASLIGDRASISDNKFVAGLAYMKFTPAAGDSQGTVTIASTKKDTGHYAGLFVGKASVKFRTAMNSQAFEVICFEPTIMSGLSDAGKCYTVSNGDISAFKKARVTLKTSGNVASLDVDTNSDGVADYSFSHTFSAALGSGVGLMANNEGFTSDNLNTSK